MKRTLILLLICLGQCLAKDNNRPNILLITVDDMSCDSVSSFGCPIKDITPHIDKLASQGIRFKKAHVQVGNCYPSRNVMLSGRYPHSSGVEGFYQIKDIKYPVACDLMKSGGYYSAIRGKVNHSTPYQPYNWDEDLTLLKDGKKAHMKDATSYYDSTKRGINAAKSAKKPFFININISDPHKPFWKPGDAHPTSKIYKAEDMPVPGFLHDDPVIRKELALYYSSVRRADDCVGAIMKALNESGLLNSTVVFFLSDHGMPLPFAKTQLYHHSTNTPLIVRWSGITEPGSVNDSYMVSAIDLLPTFLSIAGIDYSDNSGPSGPRGMQGKSFLPVIKGSLKQPLSSAIFKEYNENSGGVRNPMRGVQTAQYLYLFNPWSNGKRTMATATNGTATWKRMLALASENETIRKRVDVMRYRTVEELYDINNDPDCLLNLAESSDHQKIIKDLRQALHDWMKATGDHAITAFAGRNDPEKMESYVKAVQAESDLRRKNKRKKKRKSKA
ncbi:MAG: sulfatase [Verrucomicrobiota bacterium]|jgi:N-sulfoglucosamine sulfohydrolase|nr:sulfatase [Verrucomicrobiota bacterium]